MSISQKIKTSDYLFILTVALLMSDVGAEPGTIVGSAHDFGGTVYDGHQTDQVCVFCHTPHNATTDVPGGAPLWNRDAPTTTTYTLYSANESPTLDATDLGQPSGISLLCLSCHDGSVAIDSYGGLDGTVFITDDNLLIGGGNDLSDDHPISFTYDDALADTDGALFQPSGTSVTIGSAKTKEGTLQSVMLFNDKLECSSCHDVHNTFTSDYEVLGEDGELHNYLLKISMVDSQLCTTCHDK